MSSSTLITQAAWARRHGFSRQYVSQLVRKGVVRLVDGRIDPAEADATLAAMREPARPQRRARASDVVAQSGTTTPKVPSADAPLPSLRGDGDLPTMLLKTRIKSEVGRANLLELKSKVEAGKYVDADEVRAAAFNRGRAVRDNLLNIAGRLAAVTAAESDERKCFELIDAEIKAALEVLTKDIGDG